MNPKAIKKLLSGADSYVTITWHRFFWSCPKLFWPPFLVSGHLKLGCLLLTGQRMKEKLAAAY